MKMNQQLQQTINLQQKASNPKNSVWVFASAGSGKTKILIDRVLRLLLEGTEPNKILCLTFTNAAAAEMQDRVNSELLNWALSSNEELQNILNNITGSKPTKQQINEAKSLFTRLIDDEYKVKIQTIHSFCQNIIKIFPFEANTKPTFELIEDKQVELLLKQARKNLIKQSSHSLELQKLIIDINKITHEENFWDLIDLILRKKDNDFLNNIDEENLLKIICKGFGLDHKLTKDEVLSNFCANLNKETLQYLSNALKNSKSSKNQISGELISKFLSQDTPDLKILQSAFLTKEKQTKKLYDTIAKDEEFVEKFEQQAQEILKFIDIINSYNLVSRSINLIKITKQIIQNYNNLKAKSTFLDYSDLIYLTNQLLNNPEFSNWVKLKMDATFDHILVDESQDTNHNQWNIIKALSEDFFSGLSQSQNPRSIFIVGDEKQSIYGFQGANSNISYEIYHYFKNKLGDQLIKIELNNSFRSQKEILGLVDDVFEKEENANAISKTNLYVKHKAIKEGSGKVVIWPQIKNEVQEEKSLLECNFKQTPQISAAEKMAKSVVNFINQKISQNKNHYGDFMILLRNRTGEFDRTLTKYLNHYQIPFNSLSKIKFKDSLIIQDLISVAKFCQLPKDDLNLAHLLKSPFFRISEEELLEICQYKNKNHISLYETIISLEKFSEIKLLLKEFIKVSNNLNLLEFYHHLIYKNDYLTKFINIFGLKAKDIIERFIIFLGDFSNNYENNLASFLEYNSKLDFEISLKSEDQNKVKISTIHSAKGLQSKIVIMPDCCFNFNQLRNAKENIFWLDFDEQTLPIWCDSKENENSIISNYKKHKINSAKEEYLRLLYVALTRAEDELYIGGFGNSKDKDSWYEIIKNSATNATFVSEEEFGNLLEKKITNTTKTAINYIEEKKFKLLPTKSNFINQKPTSDISFYNQARGNLIHKLLEIIGKNYHEDKIWLKNIVQIIANKDNNLDEKAKAKILTEVKGFIKSKTFDEIFFSKENTDIKCEFEITHNNEIYRIDLLVIRNNEILIIDYKSDEKIPDQIPESYLEQLKKYQQAIAKIYPQKSIKAYILWVKDVILSEDSINRN